MNINQRKPTKSKAVEGLVEIRKMVMLQEKQNKDKEEAINKVGIITNLSESTKPLQQR